MPPLRHRSRSPAMAWEVMAMIGSSSASRPFATRTTCGPASREAERPVAGSPDCSRSEENAHLAMQIGAPYVFSEAEQQAFRERLWTANLVQEDLGSLSLEAVITPASAV